MYKKRELIRYQRPPILAGRFFLQKEKTA